MNETHDPTANRTAEQALARFGAPAACDAGDMISDIVDRGSVGTPAPVPRACGLASGLTIERATAADAAPLRRLHESSLVALAGDVYSPAQIRGLFASYDTVPMATLTAGRMYVARRNGLIVGSAGWDPSVVEGSPGAYLRAVFVHPRHTRQRVASTLLRAAEADAMAAGACRLTLAATLNAAPMYRRLGYTDVAPGALDLGASLRFPVIHMMRVVAAAQMAPASNGDSEEG